MQELPTTIEEIDRVIVDELQESLHLDYKESPAIDGNKRHEIAKDVSAFANSDGGILIYGIVEANHLPVRRDAGVDHTKYSREWLEQVISSNVTPRIDDIIIAAIPVSSDRSLYGVRIPKSSRGPHQAPDKKYYKRFNFLSVPMEDYEINDVKNRLRTLPPLVNIDVTIEQGMMVYLEVVNIGDQTAENVTFQLSSNLDPWIEERGPNVFTRGIKYFPPGKSYRFMYDSINAALHDDTNQTSTFNITVSYRRSDINQTITDVFHIDLMDYWNTSVTYPELYEHGKVLKDSIDKLTSQVDKLNKNLERILPIAGATGLDLSITTFRNLRHVLAGDDLLEKISPFGCGYDVFMEVLNVNRNIALRLQDFFWRLRRDKNKQLSEVEGMTAELAEKIQAHFKLEDQRESSDMNKPPETEMTEH